MQLQLRDDVPFGNVVDVEIDQAGAVPEVRFTPHPHGGPEACWFAFRLTAGQAGTRSRPTVGRFNTLAELGSRPIQAEPVQK
jgi:hypothetical protein